MDRQPSGSIWSSSPIGVTSGLTRCPTSPSTYQVKTRRPTPICGAARPAPPAACIVSVRSATSCRSSRSKSTTGSALRRRTGSPIRRIGVTLTAPAYVAARSHELERVELHPDVLGGLPGAAHALDLGQRAGQGQPFGARHADQEALARLVGVLAGPGRLGHRAEQIGVR